MLKIVALICTLTGLLTAISLEAWLRRHIVKNDTSAETYAEVRNRYSEFWSTQYIPLLSMLALAGAALFIFVGHAAAAVFLAGAVLCFVSVRLASVTVITGSTASSSFALNGDIRNSLRAAYRSAAVIGLGVTSFAFIGLALMAFFFDTKELVSLVASFALGASIVSLCIGASGNAYSGAYSLTVKSNDFTDYTGMAIGSGADNIETYILSFCAAVLLAKVGVAVSGVTSTFTAASAIRYPMIIFAAGIVSSVLAIMIYRGRIVRDPAAGLTAGNIVGALIITLIAFYFSMELLESYVYSMCIAAGLAAALLSGETSRLYSADGTIFRKHVPDVRKIGTGQTMLYSLSIGMTSVVIPALLTTVAMVVSYKLANYYGIALAAVGINSMAAANSAVRVFSINTASASEIASASDPDAESPCPADVLLTASVRSDSTGKTYSAVSACMTLVALFMALSVTVHMESTNILNISAFTGMIIGAVSVFACTGLVIRSIRLTSQVLRKRLGDPDAPGKRINALRGLAPVYLASILVPLIAGAAGGVDGLIAFASTAAVTGMCVIFAFNNSGRFFDRIATETLGTVIKLMVAVILVFAPFFIEFSGLF